MHVCIFFEQMQNLREKEAKLNRELARLREHLIQVIKLLGQFNSIFFSNNLLKRTLCIMILTKLT